jgi:hypothetical protein
LFGARHRMPVLRVLSYVCVFWSICMQSQLEGVTFIPA